MPECQMVLSDPSPPQGIALWHCPFPPSSISLPPPSHLKSFPRVPSTHPSPSHLPLSRVLPPPSLHTKMSLFFRQMRRLFGHSKSPENNGTVMGGGGGGQKKEEEDERGAGGGRRGIPFLRKSQSTSAEVKGQRKGGERMKEQGTDRGNGMLLAPGRTFEHAGGSRSPHSVDFLRPTTSTALSVCHSEPPLISGGTGSTDLADGDLDRQLMQTCADVKYESRRAGKCSAVVDANFQRQCLQAHNYVRQIYSSPPLLWSQELAGLAKTWALKLAERGRVLYPELPGIGENIFLLAGKDPAGGGETVAPASSSTGDHLTTGMELVALWSEEARKVDFEKPRWSTVSKHFTQMVWRSALEMGVARHWNTAKDCLAIVAFYRPAGNSNLPGEFAANLPTLAEVPEGAFAACSLAALIQALNRNDLGDGGFRKGPLPPVPRNFSCPPNTTKILKSSDEVMDRSP